VEIEWNHPHRVIVRVDGKALLVGGEGLFDRNPDFLIYPSSITHWEDGSAITADERKRLLQDVVAEAARRGWKFEIGPLCAVISRDLYRGSGAANPRTAVSAAARADPGRCPHPWPLVNATFAIKVASMP
jgi:hypothetical protein